MLPKIRSLNDTASSSAATVACGSERPNATNSRNTIAVLAADARGTTSVPIVLRTCDSDAENPPSRVAAHAASAIGGVK
mgnify:CR=1 FL=1